MESLKIQATDEWKMRLIEQIEAHPALWSKSSKLYSNRLAKKNSWGEVAQLGVELGLSAEESGEQEEVLLKSQIIRC